MSVQALRAPLCAVDILWQMPENIPQQDDYPPNFLHRVLSCDFFKSDSFFMLNPSLRPRTLVARQLIMQFEDSGRERFFIQNGLGNAETTKRRVARELHDEIVRTIPHLSGPQYPYGMEEVQSDLLRPLKFFVYPDRVTALPLALFTIYAQNREEPIRLIAPGNEDIIRATSWFQALYRPTVERTMLIARDETQEGELRRILDENASLSYDTETIPAIFAE